MPDDNSSIERLKKRLYSRSGNATGVNKRRGLRDTATSVNTTWQETPPPKKKLKKDRILGWILVFSAIFFVVSMLLSAFFFFADRNTVSAKNIKVEIQGPATIGGGDELVLQLVIANENQTAIKDVDLLIEYPEGTRSANNVSEALPRTRETLGILNPGDRVQRTARSVLFGEEGSQKDITVTIEYRVEGSNAIFYRDQSYEITLSNAPVTLSADAVTEISSGQDIDFTLTVNANTEHIVENVLLVAEYPFGFEFKNANPSPSAKTNVWKLGDLKPEDSRTIRISGKIAGEDQEERVFRFSVGVPDKYDDTKLDTTFMMTMHTVSVEKPFIGVGLAINGSNSPEPVVGRGSRIRADITWFNNLPDRIFDGEIEVSLAGNIIDRRSISAQDGFYRSSDDTILWTRETLPRLGELETGSRGVVSFSFTPLPFSSGESFRTPSITLDITVRGKRVSENNVPETVVSTLSRTIKLGTNLTLAGNAVYTSGPSSPTVGQTTVYTITWIVGNSTNPVGDTVVSAMLPSYMQWLGVVNPVNADVDFNEVGGQIRWNAGSLEAYTNRSVSFQVALEPSLSQVGSTPVLVGASSASGVDTFTTAEVGANQGDITTAYTGGDSQGEVVEAQQQQ